MKPIEDVKILVVGDIMLDKYVVGDVERISPEAPVPVVKVTEEYSTLGGCGNVVRNAREIGAQVNCIAAVGRDRDANFVRNHLNEIGAGDWCFECDNMTIVKERIVANSRRTQMVRVDRENIKPIEFSYIHDRCLELYFKDHALPDIIIISDYAKGMISFDLMAYLKTLGVKIIVDPKPQNGNCYNGVFMITPNEKEWASMTLTSAYYIDNVKYILVTLGKNGMELRDFNQHWKIPAEDIHMVYNVSGAGDTVVAVASTCIAMGINPVAAAKIANSCAGYVVTQPGTATVPKQYFEESLKKYGN